ncbi:MAG: T9SS type A sorting domain-containing protein, partial [Bacteroidota bacterium]
EREEIIPSLSEASSFFNVYPNPTTGNFTIELSNKIDEASIVNVIIYAMSGEKTLNAQIAGERKHEFSLDGYPTGIYLIRVFNAENQGTFKVVKL